MDPPVPPWLPRRVPDARRVARIQGAYFAITGVWPLVAPRAFQRVTGPKADVWLAQTVGALVAVVGVDLLRERGDGSRRALGTGAATALGLTETVFALRGRIRRLPYLSDAVLEAAFLLGWLRTRRPAPTPTAR